MGNQRRGGVIQFAVEGVTYDITGEWEYSLGGVKRTAILGSDGKVHGFTEETIAPFIAGKATDAPDLDLKKLTELESISATLSLAIGKVVHLNDGWYAGDLTGKTEKGELDMRFEGKKAYEVPA